jgi:hypothetical protein
VVRAEVVPVGVGRVAAVRAQAVPVGVRGVAAVCAARLFLLEWEESPQFVLRLFLLE